MVKGLLGGLTVLVEVEALVCCSTGKLQDKDGALPNPCSAAKQKRKLLLYQNYKAFCLSVFVRVCVDLCNFFFFPLQLCSYCAKKMIYSIFDEVAAKLLKPMLECVV